MTTDQERQLDVILTMVREEAVRATKRFGRFASTHEGYAVILEELDELWEKVKRGDLLGQGEEAVQVAAMALEFIVDCCGEETP